MIKWKLITTAALLAAGSAQAALVAYDNFNYSGGVSLSTGLNGGTGWSGAWASTGVNGLLTSGSGQSLYFDQSPVLTSDGSTHLWSESNRGNERDWTTAVDLGSQTLYFTALVHVYAGADVVDLRAEFYDGAGATGNMRANVGFTNGDLYTHVQNSGYNPSGGGVASGVVNSNTTYLLAMKRTSSGIFASLITADGDSDTLDSEPVSWQVTDSGNSGVDLDSMRLIANGTDGGIRIDEMRIATDWDSAVNGMVIPEPATIGLVAVFGGGVLFIRRRFMI